MRQKIFGERLRRERMKARKSLQYVAESLGKPYEMVCAWERGECSPEPHDIADLCMIFNTRADALIFGELGTPVQMALSVIVKAQEAARDPTTTAIKKGP